MNTEVDYEKANAELYDDIFEAHKNGNIAFMIDGGRIVQAKFDDFIGQHADGILYDLNRLPEVTMTLFKKSKSPRWINDIAMAYVVRGLKDKVDELMDKVDELEKKIKELKTKESEPKQQIEKKYTMNRIGSNQVVDTNIGV